MLSRHTMTTSCFDPLHFAFIEYHIIKVTFAAVCYSLSDAGEPKYGKKMVAPKTLYELRLKWSLLVTYACPLVANRQAK